MPIPVDTIYSQMRHSHLHALLDWCLRSIAGAPEGSPGYRDLYWDAEAGSFRWYFPWSNSAERIEALLWAGRALDRPDAIEAALRYATTMAASRRGIASHTGTMADGMVWYWRESGSYMTNYTMRVPPAFLEAALFWKHPAFEGLAILAGEALLRFQQSSGMLACGWYEGGAHRDITPYSINSRVIYAVWTFAALFVHTGESRWHNALERFVDSLIPLQNADGSFPAEFSTTGERYPSRFPKGHYHSYALYGLARASLLLPGEERLRKLALSLGEHLLQEDLLLGGNVYGNMMTDGDGERAVWRSVTPDFAAGYAWLHRLTGDPRFLQAARRTLVNAFLRQFGPEAPEPLRGGVPVWTAGHGAAIPAFGGFYNFWLLLAAKGMDDGVQAIEPRRRDCR